MDKPIEIVFETPSKIWWDVKDFIRFPKKWNRIKTWFWVDFECDECWFMSMWWFSVYIKRKKDERSRRKKIRK